MTYSTNEADIEQAWKDAGRQWCFGVGIPKEGAFKKYSEPTEMPEICNWCGKVTGNCRKCKGE